MYLSVCLSVYLYRSLLSSWDMFLLTDAPTSSFVASVLAISIGIYHRFLLPQIIIIVTIMFCIIWSSCECVRESLLSVVFSCRSDIETETAGRNEDVCTHYRRLLRRPRL